MKVQLFGAKLKDYKATADQWLSENEHLDIRHISVAMGPSGEFGTTFIFFEEKEAVGKETDTKG